MLESLNLSYLFLFLIWERVDLGILLAIQLFACTFPDLDPNLL